MKIGIVGWGIEGQSAYRYFGPEHEYLIVSEEPRDDFPPESDKVTVRFIANKRQSGLTGNVTDLSYLEGVDQCDKVIYSVTVTKNLEKFFGDDPGFWSKAVTIQHIFFDEVQTKNIVGVTGTKGKGTTSTLIYELLKELGKTVFLGGNIGKPVLDFVRDVQPDDWVVIELSNFQLYKLNRSPHIAVCLMIVPEHLDWHTSMEDYTAAKANLFRHQLATDIAIYFAKNELSKTIAAQSPGHKIPYFEPPGAYIREDNMIVIGDTELMPTSAIQLQGAHNLENVCAAITAVWQISQDSTVFSHLLSAFRGLEHRLELVRTIDDIKFFNDSFASTPDAAIGAMEAIPEPKVMIMGGFDRNLPLQHVAHAIADKTYNVHDILLIGASAKRLAKELDAVAFSRYHLETAKDMDDIVSQARSLAKAGDAVVLSPGFPSFDMFKNFEERGRQFKKTVEQL